MAKFQLEKASEAEVDVLDRRLNEYNLEMVPKTQKEECHPFRYAVHNHKGQLIGGISAYSVLWHILYIDVLWIHQDYRKQGLGRQLLERVESDGRAFSCHVVHLETFDFQGKEFYLREGYEIFGTLENSPKDHVEYFMSKGLN